MKTILFVTGDNSVNFVDTIKGLGYSVWNLVDFRNYKKDIQLFKRESSLKRKPVLCLLNPTKEIQNDVYRDEMTFSIHTTSEEYTGSKNIYDVIISGNNGNRMNEIERVMNIITK